MTDYFGREINKGDNVIVPVSKRSHYLTPAKVLEISEEEGKINIVFMSSPKSIWISPIKTPALIYQPTMIPLCSDEPYCPDCCGRNIQPGDKVVYKNQEYLGFSVVKSVEDSRWIVLDNGNRVRNVSIFVLCS